MNMTIPEKISASLLWAKIVVDSRLATAIDSMRSNTEWLAQTIARDVPGFTDHSILHMDALWGVAEKILTPEELDKLTTAEAFLLGAGFYLHDIGMAYAATPAGLKCIKDHDSYLAQIKLNGDEASAIAFAVRKIHAEAALELALNTVPGTSVYLLEPSDIRGQWGTMCGKIAASHHWDIDRLDVELSDGAVPLPGGHSGDLGYVAAILRLIDYAHINCDRANPLSRAFKHTINSESLLHWEAQEQINGPIRESNSLLYRSTKSISKVEAWWLFYEMMKGLDNEIRLVKRYLNKRVASQGRFSLQGVIGAEGPEDAAVHIKPDGFLPLEIHLRTGSIDRLVEILAGESLYGKDPIAAVRELIQNARDAAILKKIVAADAADKATADLPIEVKLSTKLPKPYFSIQDYGVGMNKKIITNSLLTIASDYWDNQFHFDYPSISRDDFKPAGKFGIGFLSVFMLGKRVEVTSTRKDSATFQLTLSGLGKQGELRELKNKSSSGTCIKVELQEGRVADLDLLPDKIRALAPMLAHPMQIDVDGTISSIPVDWIFNLTVDEFHQWVVSVVSGFNKNLNSTENKRGVFKLPSSNYNELPSEFWPVEIPEFVNDNVRLIACDFGRSILCLRGIAIQWVRTPGFAGVINSEDVIPDAARKTALEFNIDHIIEIAKKQTHDSVVKNLDAFNSTGFLINKIEKLSTCVAYYDDCLSKSSLRWISLIDRSGEMKLYSVDMFIDLIKNQSNIFVVYGTEPWGALLKWSACRYLNEVKGDYVLCFSQNTGSVGYVVSHEKKTGRLVDVNENFTAIKLVGLVLDAIQTAWSVDRQYLIEQKGWTHTASLVFGYFSKKENLYN